MNKKKQLRYFKKATYWIAFPALLSIVVIVPKLNPYFTHGTAFILAGTIITYGIYLVARANISPLLQRESYLNFLFVSGVTAAIMLTKAYTANPQVRHMGIIGWGIFTACLLIVIWRIMSVEYGEDGNTLRRVLTSPTRWGLIGYISFIAAIASNLYVHFGTLWTYIPISILIVFLATVGREKLELQASNFGWIIGGFIVLGLPTIVYKYWYVPLAGFNLGETISCTAVLIVIMFRKKIAQSLCIY